MVRNSSRIWVGMGSCLLIIVFGLAYSYYRFSTVMWDMEKKIKTLHATNAKLQADYARQLAGMHAQQAKDSASSSKHEEEEPADCGETTVQLQNTRKILEDVLAGLNTVSSPHAIALMCSRQRYRTFEFFMRGEEAPAVDDITIVTQLTVDRMDRLLTTSELWKGPISAAIYVKNMNDDIMELLKQRQKHANLRKRVDFHLLFSHKTPYPVNHLRNLALNAARTYYVLMVDVDLVPDPMAHDNLLKLAHAELGHDSKDLAFVVPAFEIVNETEYLRWPPKDKETIMRLVEKGTSQAVHIDRFPPAHRATDYDQWYNTSTSYAISFEMFYEPYILAKRPFPLYDERFVGYGHDKCSQTYEMVAAGYVFKVAPTSFLVHLEHPAPQWREEQDLKAVWRNWWEFCDDIMKQYGFPAPITRGFSRWRESMQEWLLFTNHDGRKYYYSQKTESSSWHAPLAILMLQEDAKQQATRFNTFMADLADKSGDTFMTSTAYSAGDTDRSLSNPSAPMLLDQDGAPLVKRQCEGLVGGLGDPGDRPSGPDVQGRHTITHVCRYVGLHTSHKNDAATRRSLWVQNATELMQEALEEGQVPIDGGANQ